MTTWVKGCQSSTIRVRNWPVWLSPNQRVEDLCGQWPVWSMTCVVNDLCGQWLVCSTTCLGQRLPGPRWWIAIGVGHSTQSTGLLGSYESIPSVCWEVVTEETWLDWTVGWSLPGITLAVMGIANRIILRTTGREDWSWKIERLQDFFYLGFPP